MCNGLAGQAVTKVKVGIYEHDPLILSCIGNKRKIELKNTKRNFLDV